MSDKKKLVIVDISSFIFRAFFAIRPLHTPEGTPVNAVYGVLNMLLKLFSNLRPTHVLLARDTKGPSFRKEMFEDYKANRTQPPEELVPQFEIIAELINKMGLPSMAVPGFEADDIIGSAATQWREHFDEVVIATGDKDLMQFVDEKVVIVDTMKNKTYDRDGVFEKMGVWPEQVVDYLSMVGDSSDNIPGMRGIGAKGAAKLLAEYKTLSECHAHKDSLGNKRVVTAFNDFYEEGLLSKKLIEIVTDMKLELGPDQTAYRFESTQDLIDFLLSLNFKSLARKVEDLGFNEAQVAASDQLASGNELSSVEYKGVTDFKKAFSKDKSWGVGFGEENIFISKEDHHFSMTKEEFKEFTSQGGSWTLFDSKDLWRFVFENDLKWSFEVMDLRQAHYCLHADSRHDLRTIFEDAGQRVVEDDLLSPHSIGAFSAAGEALLKSLKESGLYELYTEIDQPIQRILSSMEVEGVHLNLGYMKELEAEFEEKVQSIKKKVFKLIKKETGEELEVNLNSPKQLSKLFFETLGYPVIKKTKTGYSTDSSVLEELDSREVGPLPRLVLEYREIEKLLSTYVRPLPALVDPKGRVHTEFLQHGTQTGRLSSVNPNLQNIPIRSSNGRRIRGGFVASPGRMLLAADYSQIELRILAHFSNDPTMLEAFKNGEDIHAQTAAEVSGIAISDITLEERSKAKAVNFGLMYGQSAFGLSKSLGISRSEAKEYIEMYFKRFGKVKAYLDELRESAEEKGYTQTLQGRKRELKDIRSTNRALKANAERMAINTPIQGSAADIIKLAMIRVDERMKKEGLKSKMLLQVHDELIFEVPEEELFSMETLLREEMESAVSLEVPLTVDMGRGVSWEELK